MRKLFERSSKVSFSQSESISSILRLSSSTSFQNIRERSWSRFHQIPTSIYWFSLPFTHHEMCGSMWAACHVVFLSIWTNSFTCFIDQEQLVVRKKSEGERMLLMVAAFALPLFLSCLFFWVRALSHSSDVWNAYHSCFTSSSIEFLKADIGKEELNNIKRSEIIKGSHS